MAKIVEDIIVIRVSKLVRDSNAATQIVDDETRAALEEVAAQLVEALDPTAVVEMVRDADQD